MADRDNMVVEFQSFTGVDDLGECITILEQHDWNLQNAVQTFMAGSDSPQHEPAVVVGRPGNDSPIQLPVEEQGGGGFMNRMFVAGQGFHRNHLEGTDSTFIDYSNIVDDDPIRFGESSTSALFVPALRLLNFDIEYRDRTYRIVIHDNENVGKLKDLVKRETNIPETKQELRGWLRKNDAFIKDSDVLRDLKLPKDNTLYLLTPDLPNLEQVLPEKSASAEALERVYELHIQHTTTDKVYKVKFSGRKTIKDVKNDVFSLINVYVRHQIWTGWPDCPDTTTLAKSNIAHPVHELSVHSSETLTAPVQVTDTGEVSAQKPTTSRASCDEEMDVDSEDDHYGDDHYAEIENDDVMQSHALKPLMPNNVSDQIEAVEHFYREFQIRYGEPHPVFYIGSLEDAIKDSLQCKARERKLLAIYLHHDSSIQANVFCSQILCTEMSVSFLTSNFLSWAWDLTHESNRTTLLNLCTTHFGSVATNTVKMFQPDQLPLLLVISRNRGSNEVVQVIQGNATLDEYMTLLIHTVEVCGPQKQLDIQEEDERDAREQMLAEQDAAYQESLAVDKAKVESKRRHDEEQRLKDEEDLQRIREHEQALLEKEAEKKAISMSVATRLPEEPSANCGEPITTIRIKCPNGSSLVRRFLACNTLSVLLDYITSKDFHVDDHKVITTYPRRDLMQLDATKTLAELKLCPQETLMLEHR